MGEPFGTEAAEFATRRYMQQDVEIEVETVDKSGGFIGTLRLDRHRMGWRRFIRIRRIRYRGRSSFTRLRYVLLLRPLMGRSVSEYLSDLDHC